MIGLPAKGRQETDCSQINKTLCLYISSAPESHMLLGKKTACSQESFELLQFLHYIESACCCWHRHALSFPLQLARSCVFIWVTKHSFFAATECLSILRCEAPQIASLNVKAKYFKCCFKTCQLQNDYITQKRTSYFIKINTVTHYASFWGKINPIHMKA